MDKESLRREFLSQRRALSSKEVTQRSSRVLDQLLRASFWKKGLKVGLYYPFQGEVDVKPLLSISQIEPYLPRSREDIFEYCPWHTHDEDDETLVPGSWNEDILEPSEHAKAVALDFLDVIVVPGIVFDHRGHRLGFGQGWYDRILKNFDGVAVGLAYDFQVIEKLPDQPHDQACDWIVSESALFKGTSRRSRRL